MKNIIEFIYNICSCIIRACIKYIFPIIIAILLFGNLILEDSNIKIFYITVAFAGLWGICYFLWKSSSKETKDEYRKYLIKELNEGNVESNNLENKTTNTDKENTNYLDNVVIVKPKTDKKDIIALMLKNNDEITEYFKISKSQAKISFWVSVISCIVGIGFLAVGIYGVVILKDVSVSVISLISGSISEFVSGTVFWIHNKSALQLNHYYDKLHENEKFLSAVKIADNLSTKKREEVLVEIIHKQINGEISKIKTESIKGKGKNKQDKHKIDK